jgi:hypothetical protein
MLRMILGVGRCTLIVAGVLDALSVGFTSYHVKNAKKEGIAHSSISHTRNYACVQLHCGVYVCVCVCVYVCVCVCVFWTLVSASLSAFSNLDRGSDRRVCLNASTTRSSMATRASASVGSWSSDCSLIRVTSSSDIRSSVGWRDSILERLGNLEKKQVQER